MKKIKCSLCNLFIVNLMEANFLMGNYSHKSCDERCFKEQEKRVKYIYKPQEQRGEF